MTENKSPRERKIVGGEKYQFSGYLLKIEFYQDDLLPGFRVKVYEPEFDFHENYGDVTPQEQIDFEESIKNYFNGIKEVSERTIW